MKPAPTFNAISRRMPICLAGDVDQEKTPGDFAWMALIAMDLYEEGQDGTSIRHARDYAAVKRFYTWCQTQGATR